MFVFLYIIRLVSKLLWYALWVGVALLITMGIVLYMSSGNFLLYSERVLMEEGWVTQEQVGYWKQLGRWMLDTMGAYLK